MKRLVLFLFVFSAIGLFAQQTNKDKFRSPVHREVTVEQLNPEPNQVEVPFRELNQPLPGAGRYVNPVEIGQAGNAWGFAFGRTTYLWAVNEINSITFIHRMNNDPGTGYLAYDLSTDGGVTWSVNNETYDPNLPQAYNARYPQGVLFNPPGNSDPDNAYFSYFAPTLDGSNTAGDNTWGGYAWGVKRLAEGSIATQHNQSSQGEYHQYLPSAFTLTQLGDTWVVDQDNDGSSGEYTYDNDLIIGHGTWSEDNEEFEYEFQLMPLEIGADGINDIKVAFAPDGMTGYICVMSDLPEALPYTSYHPILFKTTDGGETWSASPIEVQLGGEDGLEAVKQFITDEMLAYHFDPDPAPPRDEIAYYMGYDVDLAVDAFGNPHIIGLVAITDLVAGQWWHYEGVFAMFHIWSTDQGETWEAFNLDNLVTFDAEWPGSSGSSVTMDNRPQVATTPDGAIVFFSWLDTRLEGIEDNTQPDIYFREYFPTLEAHGDSVENVTNLSAAMWNARWGCMSHYVFADVVEPDYYCTIPFAYEELTSLDPSLEVQFYYIPDYTRLYTDILTGTDDEEYSAIVSLGQNYPNPFHDVTSLNINLLKSSKVSVGIYSITGQLVRHFDFGHLRNGPHKLQLQLHDIIEGVYFYTLTAGNSKFTGKMIAN